MIKASLVYDGRGEPFIPDEMGEPKKGQLEGTPAEKLSELAGRVCYDSLGKGRSSQEYHEHVLSVAHLSVYEHYHFTVQAEVALGRNEYGSMKPAPLLYLYQTLANRPGVYVAAHGHRGVRITVNLRTVLDWGMFTEQFVPKDTNAEIMSRSLGDALENVAARLAPMVVKPKRHMEATQFDLGFGLMMDPSSVEPVDEHEQWVTMFLSGSRGMSHEQVRHGDWSAISQRSTRYVDENETEWITHPLLKMFLEENPDSPIKAEQGRAVNLARKVYLSTTDALQPWIAAKGTDKLSARKQARGAARGFLGNALLTELIFSASVWQWKHMLNQRSSRFADAEIRQMYEDVLQALKRTGYYESFKDMMLVPCPDGIGKCLG